MRANSVVIAEVPLDDPSQVLLTQNNRVIQAFSSDRADDTFGIRILPGRSRCRQYFSQTNRRDLPAEMQTKLLVPITQKVFGRFVQSNSFNDLPGCPICRWVLGNIGVENLPAIVTEHNQNKQHTKGCGRNREEVCGDDVFGMVIKKSTPALCWWFPFTNQVFGYRRLGYVDAELKQFAVDSRCAPEWVGPAHAPDQQPDLRIKRWATFFSTFSSPMTTKSFSVPTYDGFGFDDVQDTPPLRPQL